jgi:subtilisin-like proprotein convertase family protein
MHRLIHRLFHSRRHSHPSSKSARAAQFRRTSRLAVEELEQRTLLSTASLSELVARPFFVVSHLYSGNQSPAGFWPSQIRHAYGIDQLTTLDGTGQTIAIVDAYHDPNMAKDLAAFNSQFNLPQFNGAGQPTFTQVNENGGSPSSVPQDSSGGWELEESLDVEWAHAIAPKANILLVEANSANDTDLLTAVDTARNTKGVVAVSMSWGGSEFSGESADDFHFTTPAGHIGGSGVAGGVTFLASSGDNGTPAGWPAVSPNVVAVGGTTLSLSSTDTRVSETGWSGSGGGPSAFYAEPGYQSTYAQSSYVQNTLGNKVLLGSNRGNPDVAYAADPNPGFAVSDTYPYVDPFYGTFYGPWYSVGGTSDAAPQWAGLIALVDQARGSSGSLDGPGQTLSLLYKLGASSTAYPNDFFDVTSGNNGYSAVPGYDLVTGLGSPNAAKLVPALAGQGSVQGVTHFSITGVPPGSTAGTSFTITVTALNGNGQTVTGYTGTVVFSSTDAKAVLPASYTFVSGDAGRHTFTGVVLKTAGQQTVSVSDTSNSLVAGASATDTVTPAAVSSLAVAGFPSPASVGVAGTFTVTAKDPYGNTVTGYLGTVSFSSSDLKATLPASYTFVSSNKGTHSFSATFNTTGTQSLTAKDTAGHTGSQTGIQVTSKLQFNSTDTPGPIEGGYISISSLTIGQNVTIADLDIKVNITYPYDGDLYIHLVSPSGVDTDLSDFEGGNGANFQNTIFDSEAATPIYNGSAPFAGSYQPEMTLTGFNGKNAKGTWQLWVEDWGYANGTLNSWSIIITPSNSAPTGPAVVKGNSGSTATSNDPSTGAPARAGLPGTPALKTPGADLPALVNTVASADTAAVDPVPLIVSEPAPASATSSATLLLPGITPNLPVALPTLLPGPPAREEAVPPWIGNLALGDDDGAAVPARDIGRPEGPSPIAEQNAVLGAAAVSSDTFPAEPQASNNLSWGRLTEVYFASAQLRVKQGDQGTGWDSVPSGLASSALNPASGKVGLALLLVTCLGDGTGTRKPAGAPCCSSVDRRAAGCHR